MTISIHVDRCDTCQGDGYMSKRYMNDGCPGCAGRGWTLPDWPWVRVPISHTSQHADKTDCVEACWKPDPRWQPGATVTLTAVCPKCAIYDGHAAMRGTSADCDDGQVTVCSAVITELNGDVLARMETHHE